MEIRVHYFGMIAENTGTNSEYITTPQPSDTKNLKMVLLEKYPILEKLEFNIAVDQKLINQNTSISNNTEIALLPPFAGG